MKFFKAFKIHHNVVESVAFYFGSQYIRGIVFENTNKGIVVKKYSARQIQKFDTFDLSFASLNIKDKSHKLRRILLENGLKLAASKKAFGLVIKDLGINPKFFKNSCLISFPSNILKARISVASLQRKQQHLKITGEEQAKIQSDIFLQAKKLIANELKIQGCSFAKDFDVVKQNIMSQKIAGYPVDSLVGFRGDLLEFKILSIFINKNELAVVKHILEEAGFKHCELRHIIEGIEKSGIQQKDRSLVLVNAEDKTTQLLYLQNQVSFVAEFSLGQDDFINSLKNDCGLPENEAEQFLSQFAEGEMSEALRAKISIVLNPLFEKWLDFFVGITERKENFSFLPSTVLVFGENVARALSSRLENKILQKPLMQNMQVKIIGLGDLAVETKIKFQERPFLPLLFSCYAKTNH